MTNANDAKKKGKETISHEYNSEQNHDTTNRKVPTAGIEQPP